MDETKTGAKKLLERNRVGALLRVFSLTPEGVDHQIDSAMNAARALHSLSIASRKVFSRIDLLVSNDQEFEDSDCGLTAERLRNRIKSEFPEQAVHVFEIMRGDIYCMLLNYGIANQLEDRISYSLVMSHGLASYVTAENIEGLLAAMHQKARVAGLAISEMQDLIKAGRISNSFALWHNKSLLSVGGFDLRAQKPKRYDASQQPRVVTTVADDPNHEHSYPVAGCEEIVPAMRLVRHFGPSIAVVQPNNIGHWNVPDETVDPVGYRRHLTMLKTKAKRQELLAETEMGGLNLLMNGILH